MALLPPCHPPPPNSTLPSTCYSEVTGQGQFQAPAQGKPIHGCNSGCREGGCGDKGWLNLQNLAVQRALGGQSLADSSQVEEPHLIPQSGYLKTLFSPIGLSSGPHQGLGTGEWADTASPPSCWGTRLLCTKPCARSWHETQPGVPPSPTGISLRRKASKLIARQ